MSKPSFFNAVKYIKVSLKIAKIFQRFKKFRTFKNKKTEKIKYDLVKIRCMGDYLQRLSHYAEKGLQDFSRNPVKYPIDSLAELVKDYWDAAAVVAGAYALADFNNQVLGDYKDPLIVLGLAGASSEPIKSTFSDYSESRILRNFFAGLAALEASLTAQSNAQSNRWYDYAAAACTVIFAAAASIYSDKQRRKEKSRSHYQTIV